MFGALGSTLYNNFYERAEWDVDMNLLELDFDSHL